MSTRILMQFPDSFESERLLIRAPKFGDSTEVNNAIRDSFAELNRWMPWAKQIPTIAESEENTRQAALDFIARKDLRLLCFLKGTDRLILSSGLHRIDWDIPSFEVGYWCRTSETGKGYVTEATRAIINFALRELGAERIEIRMDDNNEKSWRVASRLGLKLEGILRSQARDPAGMLRDTRIYGRIKAEGLLTCKGFESNVSDIIG